MLDFYDFLSWISFEGGRIGVDTLGFAQGKALGNNNKIRPICSPDLGVKCVKVSQKTARKVQLNRPTCLCETGSSGTRVSWAPPPTWSMLSVQGQKVGVRAPGSVVRFSVARRFSLDVSAQLC